MRHHLFCLLLLFVSFSQTAAFANEPLSNAFDVLIDRLQGDLPELTKLTNRSTIINIESSENIDVSIRNYVLKRIESSGVEKNDSVRFVQCKDCFTIRAQTEGENVIVKKGVTSRDEVVKVTQGLDVTSYTEVQMLYSGTRVVLVVNVYRIRDASVIWAKEYETRLLATGRTGLRFSLTASQGFGMEANGYPLGVTLVGGERIYGIGTLGMYAQFLTKNGEYDSYKAFGPNVELNLSELFNSHPSWGSIAMTLRAGFGWFGKYRDFNFGGGLKVNYGSLFHVTLEGASSVAMPEEENKTGGGLPGTNLNYLPALIFIGFGVDLG